ncbi:hypothetical protein Tco_0893779 [Tanacetum coccineum]|uniref:Uncharacterized protein n=1 Tax=Tanacetum coccineum TaxID=301880 RepID=A0ABQ5CBD0_9ASTR
MNLRTRVKREEAKITAWENLQKPKAEALLGNIAGSDTLLWAAIPEKMTYVNLESLSYSSPHENRSAQKGQNKRKLNLAWENLKKSIAELFSDYLVKYVMYSGKGATEVEGCDHQIDFLSILRRAMNH